jgi:hypothetical protein
VRRVSARRALLDLDPPSALSLCAGPGPSSPGSVRCRLSTDVGSRVHSRFPSRVPFGRITAMCPVLFRLRGFAPPWRLPPLELRGLVSSRCRSEVHRVSASVVPCGSPSVLLTARLVPFEECPSSIAALCRHSRCLPAVVAAPRPCSPSRRSPGDRSPCLRRSGRRSFVRGLGRSPSFLRSSPSPGLPDGGALPPSLRSTLGPRGAPTPRRVLHEGGRAGVPLHRNALPRQVVRRWARGGRSGSGGLSTSGGPCAGLSPRSPAEAGHLGIRRLPLPRNGGLQGSPARIPGRGPSLSGRLPLFPSGPSRGAVGWAIGSRALLHRRVRNVPGPLPGP